MSYEIAYYSKKKKWIRITNLSIREHAEARLVLLKAAFPNAELRLK